MLRLIRRFVGALRDGLKSAVFGPDLPGGINDEALPSGFIAAYKKGSRQVRNLGHIDF
ncbi:MAG TPA: hypothetical protein VIF08_06765 [Candidatus Limnocylindrales bacterium]